MIKEQQELPEGWKWLAIKDLGTALTGNTPPTKNEENYGGQVPFIKPTQLVDKPVSVGLETLSEKGSKIARLLPKNGVLVSCIGNLGKTAIAKTDLAFNQQINAVIFNELIIPEYGFYCFQTGYFRRKLKELSSATTISIVNKSKFQSIKVPIAPLVQQKQIVAKIEELFSHIDAGIESLKTAKHKLKQYRQSVLKAAVTGELTKDWREQNANAEQGCSNVAGGRTSGATKIEPANQLLKRIQTERRQRWEQQKLNEFQAKGKPPKNDKWKEKYKAPEALVGNDYFEIPEDWVLINFDTVIISGPQNGIYLPKSKYGQGIPIFRIDDFQDGFAKPYSELQKVSASDLEIEVYEVAANALIINRVNSMTHIGKCMIVKESHTPAIFESNMMKMSLSTFVSVKYVELFINSRFGRKELIKNAKQAVNQASINQQDVKNTMIGLPLLEEQKEIVQRVEEKLTAADRLMAELDTKLTQAQQQKQTILASAFKGELVNAS